MKYDYKVFTEELDLRRGSNRLQRGKSSCHCELEKNGTYIADNSSLTRFYIHNNIYGKFQVEVSFFEKNVHKRQYIFTFKAL